MGARNSKGLAPKRVGFVAMACVLLTGLASVPALANDEKVYFAGWGGSIQENQREVFFDAFEEETGIEVVDVPDAGFAKIKAMVESGDVRWDVVQSLGMWVPQGAEQDLWTPLDYDVIETENVPNTVVKEHGIGATTYGMIIAYNSDTFPGDSAPSTWPEFWDTEAFPGRRGLQDAPRYTLEMALMADGVAKDDLYPLDVDRAFAALDRIRDDIAIWWSQWPQVPILIAAGELDMSYISHTRVLAIQEEEDAPVKINWAGLMTTDYLAVPKNAPNPENAMKLIDFMMRAKKQAAFAEATGIGPTNLEALESLPQQVREKLPSYHYERGNLVAIDDEWWAENRSAMQERWNEWKVQ